MKAQSRVVANESEQAVSRDNTDRAIFILREDYATTENMTKRVMPAFVFARRLGNRLLLGQSGHQMLDNDCRLGRK